MTGMRQSRANVANIQYSVKLSPLSGIEWTMDIMGHILYQDNTRSHLPDSTSDRQSTRDIFSVITVSFGLTSRISFVQLNNFWKE